jgi:hypothetical protein
MAAMCGRPPHKSVFSSGGSEVPRFFFFENRPEAERIHGRHGGSQR